MTAFLIDEMFPVDTAVLLRDTHGQDAAHVAEIGLRGAEDTEVAEAGRRLGRAVVTENVADLAPERDVVLVFVLKRRLPAGTKQSASLANVLAQWARVSPDPYLGAHWPPTD